MKTKQDLFQQRYAAASAEIRKKAPVLRTLILAVLGVMPVLAASDFLTGDYLNTGAELLFMAVFAAALLMLRTGRYVLSARLVVLSAFVLLSVMTFLIDEPNRMYLYRSAAYNLVALALGALFSTERRLLNAIYALGGLGILAFSLASLGPAYGFSGEFLSSVLVAEVLFVLGGFLILKSNSLAWGLNAELDRERARNEDRAARLSSVVEGAYANMRSINTISARLGEIIRIVGEAGVSIRSIEDRVRELEETAGESSRATERIADRIRDLNGNIEEESAAQIESSASINEMVASIRSVADSANRRQTSMAVLADTTADGMTRLNDLLQRIGRIEGSIGSIQEMVSVINHIAGSTNLLSMNAAIEAAHAGDAGRGFAVVADEIRGLADTAGKNSKEIGRRLREVIEVITGAAEQSAKTKDAFERIRSEIEGAMDAFREISTATEELAEGGRQILEAIKKLNEVSTLVRDGGAEIGAAQETLEANQGRARDALGRVREGAGIVLRKNEAIRDAAERASEIGAEGVRLAEDLHRRSEAAGSEA